MDGQVAARLRLVPAGGAHRERTPDGFTFNVKAFSLLTQHPTRPSSLHKDLRAALGEMGADR